MLARSPPKPRRSPGTNPGLKSGGAPSLPGKSRKTPKFHFEVVNVVASTKLSRSVRLEAVAAAIPGVSYETEQFPGAVYRRTNPKATIILFANGKYVSTGAASERKAREALKVTLPEIVRAEGVPARMKPVRTVNVVATGDFGERLNLSRLFGEFPDASYEPEAFPGMVLHNEDRSVVLLFGSGKFVCSGSKSVRLARGWVEEVRRRLVTTGQLRQTRGGFVSLPPKPR